MAIPAPHAEAQAASGALISEFRFHGAGGPSDEYVELYNSQAAPLDISGWQVQTQTATGTQTATVPANTPPIPARGHFLLTGSGYNALLALYGASDASLGTDAKDDSGVALLDAAGALQDAVGFSTSDASLREGAGLPSAPNVAGEYAFLRSFNGGLPTDSGDNAADFVFLSTDGAGVAGTGGPIAAQLGAPNPEGLTSPVNLNAQVGITLLQPEAGLNAAPNRVRTGAGNEGTLLLRRTLKNNGSLPLTRVRLFVTRITSQGSPAGIVPAPATQADVRLISSGNETVTFPNRDAQGNIIAGDASAEVFGTRLEAPSVTPITTGTSPNTLTTGGGGLGASLSYDVVLTTPLAAGTTANYAFNLQIAKGGTYFVAFNILGLSAPAAIIDLSAYLGNSEATLNWTAISGATSYKIERKVAGGTYAELATRPTAPTFTDTGLTNGTTYAYRVYALNASGSSAASNEASVTPNVVIRGVDVEVGAGTTLVGENVLFPDEQTHTVDCGPGVAAVFRLRIKNTGNTRDTFRLSGRGDTPGWKVRYFDALSGGSEISSQIKPNNYLVTLDRLASRDLRVEVTPDASVPRNEAKDVPVSARSEGEPLYNDQVVAKAVQREVPPPPPAIIRKVDASIRLASQSAYQGIGAQSPQTASAAQTVEGFASGSSTAVFNWRVQNEGNATDSVQIGLPATPPGWTVRLFDALDGGTEVTTGAQNGSYKPQLAPGAFIELRLEVRPDAATLGSLSTGLSAASVADPTQNDVCAANTSALSSTTDSPVVLFTGPSRAVAGGLDNALHKTTLTLNATQGGIALPNTTFTLSFENNLGHNYGTITAPNIPRRAKIYDPTDLLAPWKETLTVTTDDDGQVPVTLLSSDVISQPRLIARWESAGEIETVGGVKFDCAQAISRRGVEDAALMTNPTNWSDYDTGWSCNFSALEDPENITTGLVYMKLEDLSGVLQPVVGHSLKVGIQSVTLRDDSVISDKDELRQYVIFIDAADNEVSSPVVTTQTDGTAAFRLKAKEGINLITSVQFAASNTSQWAN